MNLGIPVTCEPQPRNSEDFNLNLGIPAKKFLSCRNSCTVSCFSRLVAQSMHIDLYGTLVVRYTYYKLYYFERKELYSLSLR